ncbi:MAG: ArsR family transcriptional regulator [Ilumatobacteraceae bacterium]
MTTPRSSLQRRANVFAALGDPRRLEIAEELSRSDRTPGELIEKFELSSALLAHHLDVLEHAGLIERTNSHADRRKRFVRLLPQHRTMLAAHEVPREVTFVCTHNSARSQLAAALWRHLTGRKASSAGTRPADRVHPSAIEVAEHHGLDLRTTRPRRLGRIKPSTTLITVCDQAHDELPASLRRLHWSVTDPAEVGTMRAFNDTFTTLHERITLFSTPTHPRKE